MKDYSFAEALEDAKPRLDVFFEQAKETVETIVANIVEWWEPQREDFLAHYDTLDEDTRKTIDALEKVWSLAKKQKMPPTGN